MDGLCELVQSSYKVYEKNKRLIRIRDGTRCKKGRLRRLSRTWVMVRRTRKESRQSGYFENDMETRLIEEFRSMWLEESVPTQPIWAAQ